MRLAKFTVAGETVPRVGVVQDDRLALIGMGHQCLSEVLHSEDPAREIRERMAGPGHSIALSDVRLLAPLDDQEVWGAGVTYERSKTAREEESEHAATFYDRVYTARRPELFFKATPNRVSGPDGPIRVRADSRWSVPEPELALVLSPSLKLVGFTIGNDVSARDIEGENPLYLPQAKFYENCCALGPFIALASALPPPREISIHLRIDRAGAAVYSGETSTGRMARTFEELVDWLGRDNVFPNGVVLLTGTGIVPPDDFSLEAGDVVRISITGIGTLSNPVVQRGAPA